MEIPRTNTVPAIDGDMDDIWKYAAVNPVGRLYGNLRTPEDLSGEYRMMWDDNNLYLFVSVVDDILFNTNSPYWYNDVLQFYIDGNTCVEDNVHTMHKVSILRSEMR